MRGLQGQLIVVCLFLFVIPGTRPTPIGKCIIIKLCRRINLKVVISTTCVSRLFQPVLKYNPKKAATNLPILSVLYSVSKIFRYMYTLLTEKHTETDPRPFAFAQTNRNRAHKHKVMKGYYENSFVCKPVLCINHFSTYAWDTSTYGVMFSTILIQQGGIWMHYISIISIGRIKSLDLPVWITAHWRPPWDRFHWDKALIGDAEEKRSSSPTDGGVSDCVCVCVCVCGGGGGYVREKWFKIMGDKRTVFGLFRHVRISWLYCWKRRFPTVLPRVP